MKILFGFFLIGALTLSAAPQPAPEAVEQGVWKFEPDQWSKKEAKVWKGMSRTEAVQALGKWYSAKSPKNEPDVVILRYYRDTAGPAALEKFAGQDSLHYFMHEDRIEVYIKSGVLVDVVVTRGRDRERHDEIDRISAYTFNSSQPVPSWNSTGGMMMEK